MPSRSAIDSKKSTPSGTLKGRTSSGSVRDLKVGMSSVEEQDLPFGAGRLAIMQVDPGAYGILVAAAARHVVLDEAISARIAAKWASLARRSILGQLVAVQRPGKDSDQGRLPRPVGSCQHQMTAAPGFGEG